MYGNLGTNCGNQFSPSTVGSGQPGMRLGGEYLYLLNYIPGPENCFRDCLNDSNTFEFGNRKTFPPRKQLHLNFQILGDMSFILILFVLFYCLQE